MAFSAASLIVLWLMQTVFFDDVYGFYKKQVMKSQAEVIVENINNAEINSLIASISQDNNLSIYIINQSGLIKYVSQRSTTVRINKVSKNIFSYWALAAGSNGIYEGVVDGPSLVGEDGEIFEYNPQPLYRKRTEKIRQHEYCLRTSLHFVKRRDFHGAAYRKP